MSQQTPKHNPQRILIIFIVIAVLTALLASSRFMSETVVPAIYVIIQVAWALINTMPRLLLWMLFALIAGQVVLSALIRLGVRATDRPASTPLFDSNDLVGPVEQYSTWIAQTRNSSFFRARLARHLGTLTYQTETDAEGPNRLELERLLKQNGLDLPDEVQSYLLSGIGTVEETQDWRDMLLPSRLASSQQKPIPDQAALENIVAYLEQQLDIKGSA